MLADYTMSPDADDDVADAYGWYERQRAGLGDRFLAAVQARIDGVRRVPLIHPISIYNYRRAFVHKFPYAVVYDFEDDLVYVLAVYHTSRDPRTLLDRLS